MAQWNFKKFPFSFGRLSLRKKTLFKAKSATQNTFVQIVFIWGPVSVTCLSHKPDITSAKCLLFFFQTVPSSWVFKNTLDTIDDFIANL